MFRPCLIYALVSGYNNSFLKCISVLSTNSASVAFAELYRISVYHCSVNGVLWTLHIYSRIRQRDRVENYGSSAGNGGKFCEHVEELFTNS